MARARTLFSLLVVAVLVASVAAKINYRNPPPPFAQDSADFVDSKLISVHLAARQDVLPHIPLLMGRITPSTERAPCFGASAAPTSILLEA
jgi:hypothetical protein